jgi:hypothetical protein
MSPDINRRPLERTSLLLQDDANHQLDPDGNSSRPVEEVVSDRRSVRENLRRRFFPDCAAPVVSAPLGSDDPSANHNEGDGVYAHHLCQVDLERGTVALPFDAISSVPATFASPSSHSGLSFKGSEMQSSHGPPQLSPDTLVLDDFAPSCGNSDNDLTNVPLATGNVTKDAEDIADNTPNTNIDSAQQTPDQWTPPQIVVLGDSPRYDSQGSDCTSLESASTQFEGSPTHTKSTGVVGLGICEQ